MNTRTTNPSLQFLRVVLALAAAVAAFSVHAVQEVRGTTPGGAAFVIAVPDDWQPGRPLVFYNHGYSFDLVESPSLGPLAQLQLGQGLAVVASGYRQRGWALFSAIDDNAELLAEFRSRFGEPGPLYLTGGSMGGLVSLKQAEDARFAERTAGVFALCAPVLASRAWDFAFDLRMIYDRVCDGVGGGELPTGEEPLPYALDLDDVPDDIDLDAFPPDDDLVRALLRVTQCTGLFLPESLRTSSQRNRLTQIQALSGIQDEDFLATNLGYATYGLSDLVRSPDKLDGHGPFDNRRVVYGDTAFDAGVARYTADPFALLRLRASSDLRGAGSAKILALATTRDELVVPQHHIALSSIYPASRLSSSFVEESRPTHCSFTTAEGVTAFQSLLDWTQGGGKPDGTVLDGRCREFGPESDCRFTAQAPTDLPVRLRSRDWTVPYDISGSWFDTARSGEGLVIEAAPDASGTVLVSWYTYNAAGAPGGEQLWIVGTGERYGNTLLVRDAHVARGPSFVSGNAPVQRTPWGSLEIVFESVTDGADAAGLGRARLHWQGPAGFGEGELTLVRATFLGDAPGAAVSGDAAPVHRSGTYVIPGRDGNGVVVQQEIRAGGVKRSFLTWYTFDTTGQPLWLTGARLAGNALVFDVIATRGTRFGAAFDADDVVRVPWGRVTLTPSGCGDVSLTTIAWVANDPSYGSGSLPLMRLSDPRNAAALTPPICE